MWATEVDPVSNHALPPEPLWHTTKRSDPLTTTKTGSESTSVSFNPRKRPADGLSTIGQPLKKKPRTKSASGRVLEDSVDSQVGESDEGSFMTDLETQRQASLAIRVCHYLLEMFSVPLLRSHATISLVDRDRLQLYHANRSVIFVSSAMNLSEDEGLTKFIAMIIGFSCLSC